MRRRRMMLAWLGSVLVVGAALVWAKGLAAAPPLPLAAPLIASAQVSEGPTAMELLTAIGAVVGACHSLLTRRPDTGPPPNTGPAPAGIEGSNR